MNKGCCFIDTGALFKRYIEENGTDKIDELFESAGLLIISSLTIIEVISNLKRLLDIKKTINIDIYNKVKSKLFNDIANGVIKVEYVSSKHIITSVGLLDKNYITPIDSLQLSVVINLREDYENIAFVCSDIKLCNLAEQKGIKVVTIE